MDAGDVSVGLWLMVSLVPLRSAKVSDSGRQITWRLWESGGSARREHVEVPACLVEMFKV